MVIYNVDDDLDDREFFCDAIKALSPASPCVLFESGVELLNFMDQSPIQPDYIFIDINMPKMNGYECAREIKLNYLSGDTQIVMYSTAFNPQDIKAFDKDGFRYILKQNSMTDLVQTIKTVISVPTYHLEETL